MALEVALPLHTQRTIVARGGSGKSRWVKGLPGDWGHSFVPVAGFRVGVEVGSCLRPHLPAGLHHPILLVPCLHVSLLCIQSSHCMRSCRREGCGQEEMVAVKETRAQNQDPYGADPVRECLQGAPAVPMCSHLPQPASVMAEIFCGCS